MYPHFSPPVYRKQWAVPSPFVMGIWLSRNFFPSSTRETPPMLTRLSVLSVLAFAVLFSSSASEELTSARRQQATTVVRQRGFQYRSDVIVLPPDTVEVNASTTTPPHRLRRAQQFPPPPATVCSSITVSIVYDNYPSETSWIIRNAATNSVVKGSTDSSFQYCGASSDELTFTIFDSAGDGICCQYGAGSYSVAVNGVVVGSGGSFTTSDSVVFTPASPTASTVCTPIVVSISPDYNPQETSWDIRRYADNSLIASGGSDGAAVEYCGQLNDQIMFTIYDSAGNGLCCSYGTGWYSVTAGGVLVGTGDEFGSMESVMMLNNPTQSCVTITQSIVPDANPAETSWKLVDVTSRAWLKGGGSSGATLLYCGDPTNTLMLNVFDVYGDGIASPGYYSLDVNGDTVVTGGSFGLSVSNQFSIVPSTSVTSSISMSVTSSTSVSSSATGTISLTASSTISLTASPSPSSSTSFSSSPTISLTSSRSLSSSMTPTISLTASPSPSTSLSSSKTSSPSLSPTRTPTISVTSSLSVSLSKTPTISVTSSRTPSLSLSTTPTSSISITSSSSQSLSSSSSLSTSLTASSSLSATSSLSLSASSSISLSSTSSISLTPSTTPTSSTSFSPTPSPSLSASPSLSSTPSLSFSSTKTPTISLSTTKSPSVSVSPTISVTPTKSGAGGVPSVTPTSSINVVAMPSQPPTNLAYYGGPIIETVNVIPVYWSTNVRYASSITTFYCALVKDNSYFKILLQYATTVAGSLQSLWYGQCGTPYTDNNPSTGYVTDAQVIARLKTLFASGALPPPGPNNYYPVHFPAGLTVYDSSNTASCVKWCAYHGTDIYNGQYMMYGIIPDMGNAGCNNGCGVGTQLQNTQSVSSHEFAEVVTDPAVAYAPNNGPPLAWYNQANGEIGDLCNAQQVFATLGDGNTYVVQQLWSNAAGGCVSSA